MFGVEIPRTGGRAGMAAIKLRDGARVRRPGRWPRPCTASCPPYALPLFVRVVTSRWSTPRRSRAARWSCASEAYGPDVEDPLYVLAGRDEGYVPYYDDYPDEVAAGKRPQG